MSNHFQDGLLKLIEQIEEINKKPRLIGIKVNKDYLQEFMQVNNIKKDDGTRTSQYTDIPIYITEEVETYEYIWKEGK